MNIIEENKLRYNEDWYDSKRRFCSYWHQISEVMQVEHDNVLEIGVGNKFLSRYLLSKGIKAVTLDIELGLEPDIKASILKLPFKDNCFDVIACYEILEHLPYEDFSQALSEVCRVSKAYCIISVPDIERSYRFNIQLPKIKEIKKLWILPKLKKPANNIEGGHFWEIGIVGFGLKRIVTDIENRGFSIEKTYRVFENPYHRFFILKKL